MAPALRRRVWIGGIKTRGRKLEKAIGNVPNGGLDLMMAAGLEESGSFHEIQRCK